MTEGYYNATAHGLGFEGFVNYTNLLVDGWMSTFFLAFIWLATLFVGNKSEWRMSSTLSFSFLLCLVSAMILGLFTIINEVVIFTIVFGLGASIFWMVIEKK